MDARTERGTMASAIANSIKLGTSCSESKAQTLQRTIVCIIVFAVLLRIFFFPLSSNAGGDAQARATRTALWLAHPERGLNYAPWLPLHFVMMGALGRILGHAELATRLFSLLCGVGTLVPFYYLTKGLFGELAAALSLLVLAFDSLQIGYSTASSSEAPYVFFVLTGLAFFFAYLRSPRLPYLAGSGLALTCAAGMRWEPWSIIFVLSLVLIAHELRLVSQGKVKAQALIPVMIFCVTAGLFPVVWMVWKWRSGISPFFYVTYNPVWVKEQLAAVPHSLLYRALLPPGTLLLTLSVVGILGALMGLWASLKYKKGRLFCALAIFLAALQFYQILTGGVMSFARYTIGIGVFFAVISGFGLADIATRLGSGSVPARSILGVIGAVVALNFAGIVILSIVRSPVREKFRSISPLLQFSDSIEEVANFLRPRLGPDSRIIIDNFDDQSQAIAVEAGLPLLAEDQDKAFFATHRVSEVGNYLEKMRPKYIVYSPKGALREYLSLPDRCEGAVVSTSGLNTRCVFHNDIYVVYELAYPN
jgi:dolichyl-phosphate-mannose-protein mannosyltransferase